MTMEYQGLSGTVYEIEEKKLAGGGEGTVHNLIGNRKQVAKIFKEGRRDSVREKKLQLMVQEKLSEEELQQITWPQDVIYNQNGFAGYIMPRLAQSSSLMELYTEEEYNLSFRLMAACNLAQAIDTVHQMGQVCGDLNPQNIFVNVDRNDEKNRFKVTLVDTDSYHFTADGAIYRCEVGLGQFIAPELQKKMSAGYNLKNVPLPSYTRETDLFALAVHIFCLLMNGCHPFACAKDTSPGEGNIGRMAAGGDEPSIVCPQPVENIKDGFFPFYETRDGFVTPVYAPGFDSLPDKIREMFIRTFVDGYREPAQRVTASEWAEELHALSHNIVHCSEVDSHYYFDHVSKCPLCELEERIAETTGTGGGDQEELPPDPPEPDDWEWETPPEPPRQRKSRLSGCLATLSLIFLAVMVIVSVITTYREQHKENVNYSYEEEAVVYEDDRYRQLISDAVAAVKNGEYDQAIAYCIEAGGLTTSEGLSKKQAYYWEALAMFWKGDLDQALTVLQAGQAELYDQEIETAYQDLIDEIQKRKEEAAKEARETEKKLNRMNKIISAIKDKRYKRAGTLAYTYCDEHEFGKIYVQDRKIVDTVKEGKGFLINRKTGTAYYGFFKNGKRSGKGIEVGQDGYENNFKIQGIYKDNKLNGRASIYQWNQILGEKTYHTNITGNYRNNKENGQMKVIYYYKTGGVMNTYYINSSNGKRKIIRYDAEVGYVFAQTKSGDYWIGYKNRKWLSGCGHPAYYVT